MNRGFRLGILFIAIIGCQSMPQTAAPVLPEAIPPPFVVNGTTIALVDERPAWERQPGASEGGHLYRLGRVSPNPWSQLAKETEAIVAAMPEKPRRVEVGVTSFRLVQLEDEVKAFRDPSDQVRIRNLPLGRINVGKQASTADRMIPLTENSMTKGALAEHPPGASCMLQAQVRITSSGGQVRTQAVKALTAGQKVAGTKYYGEALDFAAKLAVKEYGSQLRQALGPTKK